MSMLEFQQILAELQGDGSGGFFGFNARQSSADMWQAIFKQLQTMQSLCDQYRAMDSILAGHAREKIAAWRQQNNMQNQPRKQLSALDGLDANRLVLFLSPFEETWTNLLKLMEKISGSFVNQQTLDLINRYEMDIFMGFMILIAEGRLGFEASRQHRDISETAKKCQRASLELLLKILRFCNVSDISIEDSNHHCSTINKTSTDSCSQNNDSNNIIDGSSINSSGVIANNTINSIARPPTTSWLVQRYRHSISELCIKLTQDLLYDLYGRHETQAIRLALECLALLASGFYPPDKTRLIQKCIFPLKRMLVKHQNEMEYELMTYDSSDSTTANDNRQQHKLMKQQVIAEILTPADSIADQIMTNLCGSNEQVLDGLMIFCESVLKSYQAVPEAKGAALALLSIASTCNEPELDFEYRNKVQKRAVAALHSDSRLVRTCACRNLRKQAHLGLTSVASTAIIKVASDDPELLVRAEAVLCLGHSADRRQRSIKNAIDSLLWRFLDKLNPVTPPSSTLTRQAASATNHNIDSEKRKIQAQTQEKVSTPRLTTANAATVNGNTQQSPSKLYPKVAMQSKPELISLAPITPGTLRTLSLIESIFKLYPQESWRVISNHLAIMAQLYVQAIHNTAQVPRQQSIANKSSTRNEQIALVILRIAQKVLSIEGANIVQQSSRFRSVIKQASGRSIYHERPHEEQIFNIIRITFGSSDGESPGQAIPPLSQLGEPILIEALHLIGILTEHPLGQPFYPLLSNLHKIVQFNNTQLGCCKFRKPDWFTTYLSVPIYNMIVEPVNKRYWTLMRLRMLHAICRSVIENKGSIYGRESQACAAKLLEVAVIEFGQDPKLSEYTTKCVRLAARAVSHEFNVNNNNFYNQDNQSPPSYASNNIMYQTFGSSLFNMNHTNFANRSGGGGSSSNGFVIGSDNGINQLTQPATPIGSGATSGRSMSKTHYATANSPLRASDTGSNRLRSQLIQLVLAGLTIDPNTTLDALNQCDNECNQRAVDFPEWSLYPSSFMGRNNNNNQTTPQLTMDTTQNNCMGKTLDLIFKLVIQGSLCVDIFCPHHEVRVALYGLAYLIKLKPEKRPLSANELAGDILLYIIEQFEWLHRRYEDHLIDCGQTERFGFPEKKYLNWSPKHEQIFETKLDEADGFVDEIVQLRASLLEIDNQDKNWSRRLTENLHLTQLKLLTQDLYNYADQCGKGTKWRSFVRRPSFRLAQTFSRIRNNNSK